MNDVLVFAVGIGAVISIGFIFPLIYIAARVYVRASQYQQVFFLPIDSLSQHAWDILYDRLSTDEFQALAKRLESHNIESAKGSREAAPTVREVLRNLP